VDLTGYTRPTEERGDTAAAELAGRLAALVEGISRHHGGRPVRWLGDGGMLVFREPGRRRDRSSAVRAGSPQSSCGGCVHVGTSTTF
jgi:class 3 adenylate cyclase